MKNLEIFEGFKERKDIRILCNGYNIKNYTLDRQDDSVSVERGYVSFNYRDLIKIPIKFKRINGDFYCNNNEKLKDLKNCPIYVSGNFDCAGNSLITLVGGPQYVGSRYNCANNLLKDMNGFPEIFKGILLFQQNPVTEIINLSIKFPKSNRVITDLERSKVNKFVKFLNEYQVIRNGNIIIEDRLRETFYEIGYSDLFIRNIIDNVNFKNYKLL